MIRNLVCLVSLCLFLSVGVVIAQDSGKEQAAVAVAKKWLTMVDQGEYEASWKGATQYFKNAVTQDQWKLILAGS